VAQQRDGLLLQVGVVGMQGIAQGGLGVGRGGDGAEQAADVADAAILNYGFDGGERPGVGHGCGISGKTHPGTFEAGESGNSTLARGIQ